MKLTHTKLALAVLFAALVMTSLGASAQWTAAPSTCAVDEDSIYYYQFSGSNFTINKTANGNVATVRCTVANPMDSVGANPAWATLHLGYYDPGPNGYVKAYLWRASRTTFAYGLEAAIVSRDGVTAVDPGHVLHPFDFTNYLYFVTVEVQRYSSAYSPGIAYNLALD